MNKHISLTAQAHNIIKQHLISGDTAIDATVGNGYDCTFLARQVGKQGMVFGFDIQKQAITATQIKLENEKLACNIKLIHDSHSKMDQHIPLQQQGKIKAIMFNLGYLPGSDKSVITQADATLTAINTSLSLLAADGILTITAYPGHSGGEIEVAQIKQWLSLFDAKHYTQQTIYSSEKITAPILFVILKKHL